MSGIVDLHVHTAPSLLPRHHSDGAIGQLLADVGVGAYVLKAHEGSTAERALLAGGGAVGAIVLNSPVGGANPDAVTVAARFGARVVWMPTLSSETHRGPTGTPALAVHRGVDFRAVPVCRDRRLLPEWYEVLDLVAQHDLVLASGHLSMDETVEVFRAARSRGVQRLVVTHPLLEFLGWRPDHVEDLVELDAHLEVGVLADLLDGDADDPATVRLSRSYPTSLLVFGSDLGHKHYPDVGPGIGTWLDQTGAVLGENTVDAITTSNGKQLLGP